MRISAFLIYLMQDINMIADEITNSANPNIDLKKGSTLNYIIKAIKNTCVHFKKASKQTNLKQPLNENNLSQIFVEQVDIQIMSHPFIGVKNQYTDVISRTKGIPDIYFHQLEEGVVHQPLFIMESKRLPSQTFTTEYVIGDKKNGGIERYKIEKHGKGHSHCGMIGFIEKDDFDSWTATINKWVKDIAAINTFWNVDEILKKEECATDYFYLKSIAHRTSSSDLLLHHFWVMI
jgi:hypothetical protein